MSSPIWYKARNVKTNKLKKTRTQNEMTFCRVVVLKGETVKRNSTSRGWQGWVEIKGNGSAGGRKARPPSYSLYLHPFLAP